MVKDSFYIVYYHEGVAASISATFDTATKTLTFNASEFSTYTLVNKTVGTLDTVHKTGDATGLGGWMALVMCSILMLAGVAVYDKKRAK